MTTYILITESLKYNFMIQSFTNQDDYPELTSFHREVLNKIFTYLKNPPESFLPLSFDHGDYKLYFYPHAVYLKDYEGKNYLILMWG